MAALQAFVIVCGALLVVAAQKERIVANLDSATPDVAQAQAAQDLLRRLLGSSPAEAFHLGVDRSLRESLNDGLDVAVVNATNNVVHIVGSSGATAVWGLAHYLRQICTS